MQNHPDFKVYLKLFTLVIVWGLAWPISKVGLADMTPMWYSAGRFMIGITAVLMYLMFTKQLQLPKREDLPLILSIGLFQMSVFLMLLNYGLYYVGAGRAATLVYSTPLWVTPIAILFFGETLNRFKLAGLILGLLGVMTLFNPWGFDWHDTRIVIGNLMLATASLVWAGVMLHTRFGKWHSKPIALVPWQLLLATIVTTMTALLLEPHPHISWNGVLISTLLYNGLFATAFGYLASITVTKSLPVVTSSLCFLGVPVVGLLSSMIFLEEKLTLSLGLALALIIGGLILVTLSNFPKKPSK